LTQVDNFEFPISYTYELPPNSTLPSFPRLILLDERHTLLLDVVKAAVLVIDRAVVSRKDLMIVSIVEENIK